MTLKIFLTIRCAVLGSKWLQGHFRPLAPFRPPKNFVFPTANVSTLTITSVVARTFLHKR